MTQHDAILGPVMMTQYDAILDPAMMTHDDSDLPSYNVETLLRNGLNLKGPPPPGGA